LGESTVVPGAERPANRMRPGLLIVGDFLSQSMALRFICEELAERLANGGWSVTTASSFAGRGTRFADMLATTWLRHRRYEVALVDVYSGSSFLWAEAVTASLTALRRPTVLVLRSGALPAFADRWPGRVSRLLRAADVVVSPSAFLRQELRDHRPDIRVIPNALDLGLYPRRLMAQAGPRLIWLRSFERRYNPVLALEVVERLSAEFPQLELLMVGADRGDWSGAQTAAEAEARGIGGRVRVRGPVPAGEVPQILSQGDIFLNTTDVDNSPKTVHEAMAAGLCLVSTAAGGVPFIVRDGHDGLLVPRGDAAAMAAAVRRILTEPALAARLSRGARATAEELDWSRVLPRWQDLLSSLRRRGMGEGLGVNEATEGGSR